jgi:anti-anti-sigma factor
MGKKPAMFRAEESADCSVISVSGEFTYEDTGEFKSIVKIMSDGRAARRISLDLAECGFVDSGCMGAMAQAQKELSARGGGLLIVNPQPEVLKAMCRIRLDVVIPIEGKRE